MSTSDSTPVGPTKRCTGPCGRELPATTEYFGPQVKGKYGVKAKCRECNRVDQAAYYATHREERITYRANYRASHPEECLVSERAYRNAHREKLRVNSRNYAASHREEKHIYNVAYYSRNCERERARHAKYYTEHADEMRARSSVYRKAHREERIAACIAWRAANSEKVAAYASSYRASPQGKLYNKAASHRRWARQHNAGADITADELKQIIAAHTDSKGRLRCARCGKVIKGMYHLDHFIPLSKGGNNSAGNYRVMHPRCNQSKKDKLPHEIGMLL